MDGLPDQLEIGAASCDQDIRALSGGSRPKAIVARWLSMRPELLIFIEPKRSLDVNSKAAIYHLMRDLAREAAGLLMISSDSPEVIGAAGRGLVMQESRIAAFLLRSHRTGHHARSHRRDGGGRMSIAEDTPRRCSGSPRSGRASTRSAARKRLRVSRAPRRAAWSS